MSSDRLISEEEDENYQLFGLENQAAADGVEILPDEEDQPPQFPDISRRGILAYSIGHFLNDLCASMWFTYLMIYLEKVIMMHSYRAGFLMLLGQVTDALSTPLVGLLSDASILPKFLEKYGRRKAWHIIGTCCVTLSFPFIFADCLLCKPNQSEWFKVLWFAPFIMLFQFGWAATQISHLALIPELSTDPSKRVSMNSYRNAFNVVANLTIFSSLYILLNFNNQEKIINPADLKYFRSIGIGLVVLGLSVVSIFYWFVKEPQIRPRENRSSFSSETSHILHMSWHNWFSQKNFYLVAMLFMLSRLYINLSSVYFPFYITLTRDLHKAYVAILPMVGYLSSFFVSCILGISTVNQKLSRKALFITGSLIGVFISFMFFFLLDKISIYFVASLLGVAQSLLLISSLGITAQLINKNTESGAFVYGAMSFSDKLSNGIAIQIIELINPTCNAKEPHIACFKFYRVVMSCVPGACAILIFVLLLFLKTKRLGRRERDTESTDTQELLVEPVEFD